MNNIFVDYYCKDNGLGACKYHSSGMGAGNGCDHCIIGYCYNYDARIDAIKAEIELYKAKRNK